MNPQANPYTPEHCELCNQLLQSVAVTRELCEACERAGLPVGPAREENENQLALLNGLKREFMSTRP
jgi:hypothetical protein